MPLDRRAIAGVDDSKRLDAAARERLATRIRAEALALGLAAAPVAEIARYNILEATVRAMGRALDRVARQLGAEPGEILIDGKPLRTLGRPHRAIVQGDGRCYSIGCASIVAKVLRDRLMTRLDPRYPAYGWASNAGYGTPAHLEGLRRAGLTAHHRVSFCRSALGRQLEL